jgi:hypothetical protein
MIQCYMFKENVSAACASQPEQSSRTVRGVTHVGRYPPAYYLAVGWPSLLTASVAGTYLMQSASAVLCAMFLALAVATPRRWSNSSLLVPAISVSVTPMVLFLNSSVNPSGLEVASAATAWTAATVLVAGHFETPVVLLVAVAHSDGYAGQGRYFLPIWEGVPIVAAGLLGFPGVARQGRAHKLAHSMNTARAPIITGLTFRRDLRRWTALFSVGSGVLVGTGQAVAFYWALRRYIVGIPGPLFWSGSASSGKLQWHPPVPGWWLLAIFVALCAVYGVAISRACRTTRN